MSVLYLRKGGAWVPYSAFHRISGAWKAWSLDPVLSSDVYADWTFYEASRAVATPFSSGGDRVRLLAIGAAGYHTASKVFVPAAGSRTVSVKLKADTTHRVEFEFYRNGAYLAWGGKTDLNAGTNSGGATITSLGNGEYLYTFPLTIAAGTTSLEVRLIMVGAGNTASFTPAGEAIFAGLLTIT